MLCQRHDFGVWILLQKPVSYFLNICGRAIQDDNIRPFSCAQIEQITSVPHFPDNVYFWFIHQRIGNDLLEQTGHISNNDIDV